MFSKKEEVIINSTLLLLGISNFHPPIRMYGLSGGLQGTVRKESIESRDNIASYVFNHQDPVTKSLKELIKEAFKLGSLSNPSTPVSFLFFCNLDDENHNEFIANWLEKINQEKHAKIQINFVGFRKGASTTEEMQAFNQTWNNAFNETCFIESPQDLADFDDFVLSKMKKYYLQIRVKKQFAQKEGLFYQIMKDKEQIVKDQLLAIVGKPSPSGHSGTKKQITSGLSSAVDLSNDENESRTLDKSEQLKKQITSGLSSVVDLSSDENESRTPDESDPKKQFLQRHQEMFQEDKSQCLFGFFRRTKVIETMRLEDIIHHAQKQNNRSRKVCVELGWMSKDGALLDNSPLKDVQASAYLSKK